MSSVMYERMRVNPKFQKLVHERGRFAWTLSATIVLVLFYGFFMLVAFNPGCWDRRLPRDRCGRSATPSNFVCSSSSG
jgi:uncharacterized membrane protein (DUF485 family)